MGNQSAASEDATFGTMILLHVVWDFANTRGSFGIKKAHPRIWGWLSLATTILNHSLHALTCCLRIFHHPPPPSSLLPPPLPTSPLSHASCVLGWGWLLRCLRFKVRVRFMEVGAVPHGVRWIRRGVG